MRYSVVVCALLVLVASPAASQPWVKGSFNDALAAGKAQNKPLLIDFLGVG